MNKLIRAVLAIVLCCFAIYAIESVIGTRSAWFTLILIFCISSPILLIRTATYHNENRTSRQEYIINLKTGACTELFDPKKYPDYQQQSSGTNGNDYISSAGSVLCTKYVTKQETVKVKDSQLGAYVYSIVMCFFIFLLWSGFISRSKVATIAESRLTVVWNQLCWTAERCAQLIVRAYQRAQRSLVVGGEQLFLHVSRNITVFLQELKTLFS